MAEFSWKDIVTTVFGGGIIAVLITVLNLFFSRYDARKKERKELQAEDRHLAIENKKIALDADGRNREELWKIINEKAAEIDRLKMEVKLFRDGESLSRPRITQIYIAVRNLRRQIDALETLMAKRETDAPLVEMMQAVRERLDEVQAALP